ncbi:MAG: Mycothiol acetyltransferase [Herbaspirillum frisingense]|uniref:Mycothiol acetyltransferase n=1 Tax=Herbaspirillum frisingense TaxID=92645 RepID=A0A7V8FYI5_9BURK|nr:MAG: Mycothiol acetyltransferase [Herbaspirillum frisingense]
MKDKKMSTAVCRAALAQDLDQLAALFDGYRMFYDLPGDLALSRRYLTARMAARESQIFVSVADDGRLTGFCQLYPGFCSLEAARIYTLYDLYVDPAARGSGAGRLLLRAAQDFAREQGAARMDLTTARSNARAQSLYESEGWRRDEVFLAYQWFPETRA